LDLFTNTHRGCSVPDLAEFYTNCAVTKWVVTSTVNGHQIRFDASELGEMLGIPAVGFDVHIREDKSTPGDERLLELTQKFTQQPEESSFQSVRKGEMMSLHRLLFWFIIKNINPLGQGRNLADPIDMCLTD